MAQISMVRKSQLEGAMRLDAEYYQPKYLEIARILKQQPKVANVGSLCKLIYRYPSFYNLVYQDHGVLVLKGEDIDAQGVIDNTKADHISRETSESFPKTILKKYDLIISVRGYVGKTGLVDSEYEGAIISPNLIRLEVDSSKISPVYLWVFLNSRYGNLQIARAKMQTSQETIVSSDIKNMLVPLPSLSFQTEIENIVEIATKQGFQSKSLYLQAEQLLLDEIGFKDLDLSHQLCWTVPFKKTKEAGRLDAEHFQPKYEHALSLLGQSGLQVKDIAKVSKDPFKARAGQPFNYIEIGNVHSNGLADSEKVLGEAAPSRATWAVHTNDVITSTVRPIRRLSALIEEEQEGYVCSSGFVVFQATGIQPEVFLVFLRLPIVCEILDLKTKASMYPAISTDDLLELPVAMPPKRVSEQIVQLIGDGHRAWRKSRRLLEEAKSKVENLIEGKA